MVEAVLKATTSVKLTSAAAQDCTTVRDFTNTRWTPHDLQDLVHVCKITKAYRDGMSKISNMTAASVWSVTGATLRILETMGGV
eukprot:2686158-Heterocapsa_arctica.AAC.1